MRPHHGLNGGWLVYGKTKAVVLTAFENDNSRILKRESV